MVASSDSSKSSSDLYSAHASPSETSDTYEPVDYEDHDNTQGSVARSILSAQSDVHTTPADTQPADTQPAAVSCSNARKVDAMSSGLYSNTVPQTQGLPAEVWQNVFSFLPPDSLCCCLRVNKAFNTYLTATHPSLSPAPAQSPLKLVESESIWTSSRKGYAPSLPRPLFDISEHDMLSLLGQHHCQRCGKLPSGENQPYAPPPWSCGPGPNGVRIIWAFGQRLCGDCFSFTTIRDIDLYKSADKHLIPGLPFAFRTQDNHYVPNAVGLPKHIMLSKVFDHQQIIALRQEQSEAEALAPAAADEWRKGLSAAGKAKMTHVSRWAQWEGSLPLGVTVSRALQDALPPKIHASYYTNSASYEIDRAPGAFHPPNMGFGPAPNFHPTFYDSGNTPLNYDPYQVPSNNVPPQSLMYNTPPHTRAPRNLQDVADLKATRRVEIERRCMQELQPPLMPNVLHHIESFQAAIKIPHALDDHAWMMLRPRLEAQRDAAEEIEYKRDEAMRLLQATMPDYEHAAREAQVSEVNQQEFEHFQEAIRPEVGRVAEQVIEDRWFNGGGISKNNCQTFAADVFIQTRMRFVKAYQEAHPTADENRLLSLDTMKWVYDHKIRPRIEKFCPEPFRCPDCEDNGKWRAFEGIIQHYAAKHTEDFSKDNIVVHWKTASWPEQPPFDSEPVEGQSAPGATLVDSEASHTTSAALQAGRAAHQSLPDLLKSFNQQFTASQEHLYSSDHDENGSRLSHDNLCGEIADSARYIWNKQLGDPDPELAIKIQVVIHHITNEFQQKQGRKMPLYILEDALTKHEAFNMYDLHHTARLGCSDCVSSAFTSDPTLLEMSYADRMQDPEVSKFTFVGLVSHFATTHSSDKTSTDWINHMLEQPGDEDVVALLSHPMPERKRQIIVEAYPLVSGGVATPAFALADKTSDLSQAIAELNSKNKNRSKAEKRKAKELRKRMETEAHRSNRDLTDLVDSSGEMVEESEKSLPEANDDEYDPRRPAFLTPSKLTERGRRTSGRYIEPEQKTDTSGTVNLSVWESVLGRALTSEQAAALGALKLDLAPSSQQSTSLASGLRNQHRLSDSDDDHRRPRRHERRRISGRGIKRPVEDTYAEEIPDVIHSADVPAQSDYHQDQRRRLDLPQQYHLGQQAPAYVPQRATDHVSMPGLYDARLNPEPASPAYWPQADPYGGQYAHVPAQQYQPQYQHSEAQRYAPYQSPVHHAAPPQPPTQRWRSVVYRSEDGFREFIVQEPVPEPSLEPVYQSHPYPATTYSDYHRAHYVAAQQPQYEWDDDDDRPPSVPR